MKHKGKHTALTGYFFRCARGEVWISKSNLWKTPFVKSFDPENKNRPVVIVANLDQDLVMIVPGSHSAEDSPINETIPAGAYPFLHMRTVFLCRELNSIPKADLSHPIGCLSQPDYQSIVEKAYSALRGE